jgi:hypothetical protein
MALKRVQLCYTVSIVDERKFRRVGRSLCRQAGVEPCSRHAMVSECLLSGKAPLDCGIEIRDQDFMEFGGCSRRR